jgi:hypothetical protein
MVTGLEIIGVGLLLAIAGLYAYVGKHAAGFYRFFLRVRGGYYVQGCLPYGVGLMLVGLAALIHHGLLAVVLLTAGMGLMGSGLIMVFWLPYRLRPKWLRNRRRH